MISQSQTQRMGADHALALSALVLVSGPDPKLAKATPRAFYVAANGETTFSSSGLQFAQVQKLTVFASIEHALYCSCSQCRVLRAQDCAWTASYSVQLLHWSPSSWSLPRRLCCWQRTVHFFLGQGMFATAAAPSLCYRGCVHIYAMSESRAGTPDNKCESKWA